MKTHEHHLPHMGEALMDAAAALDQGEFPVGCVLVHGDRIIARGRRFNSRDRKMAELNHAEIMALSDLACGELEPDMTEVTAYTTLEPCLMCYAALLLNGIHHIVYAYEDVMGGGTSLPLDQLTPLYKGMSVKTVQGVMRAESLALLKSFFSDPRNDYLRNTLLARYTLEQP